MAEIIASREKKHATIDQAEQRKACPRQTFCSATPVKPSEAEISLLLQTPITPSTDSDSTKDDGRSKNAVATPKPHLSAVKRKLLINGSPENTENVPETPKSLAPESKESAATPKQQLAAVKRKLLITGGRTKNRTVDTEATPVAVKKAAEAVTCTVQPKNESKAASSPIVVGIRRTNIEKKPILQKQPESKCGAARLLEAGARVREERIRKALVHCASADSGVGESQKSDAVITLPEIAKSSSGTVADRSQSLLDRVRQRSEARKQWQTVRDSTYTTKLALLQRLPDLARQIRGYFLAPRLKTAGGATSLETLVEHLYKACAATIARDKLREAVDTLALLPFNGWLTVTTAKELSSSAVIHQHERYVSLNTKANFIDIMSRLSELKNQYERDGNWDALLQTK